MRLVAVLVLALAASAQAPKTRVVKDGAGRIELSVPESWQDGAAAEGELIHLNAPHGGGHTLLVVREAGQVEIDKQRDRYM
ncbi:MAG: hypothetical protein ACHQ1G_04750, partial [Planctomycetota bacterium]